MKIAIHNGPGGFHARWIRYCTQRGIPYKRVDCRASDIISQLDDCGALMWNHHHGTPEDLLFAKQLLFAVEQSGRRVFPDFNTGWHFDDKIGQKYLLESVGAPFPDTFVSYDRNEALRWAEGAALPQVFKLRCGAGSMNVRLAADKRAAKQLIRRAFGRGFSKFNRTGYMKERLRKTVSGEDSPLGALKGLARLVIPTRLEKGTAREKGYVCFQEFLPCNDHDTRVVVVCGRAFAIRRMVRRGDFRASGSGLIAYGSESIDPRCVQIALETARKLRAQCLAFDFIERRGAPVIIEMSYAFAPEVYDRCPGYWDSSLRWHEGAFDPFGWMVDAVIEKMG